MGHPPLAVAPNPIQLEQKPNQKSGGCFLSAGCLGCFGLFAVFFLSICAVTTLVVEGSRPIPGDASHYDPVASLPTILAVAGDGAVLTGFDAQFVKRDGTMDLWADYGPQVLYEFYRLVDAPNDRPIGAGGSVSGTAYEPVTVYVSRPFDLRSVRQSSGAVSVRYQYFDLGIDPEPGNVRPNPPGEEAKLPTCSLETLWDAALAQDAPANGVASIHYDSSGYSFTISGTGISLQFDHHCKRVR
ncbi:MAG: hypothetical protein U0452_03950 [Anaerolineae bacterium]